MIEKIKSKLSAFTKSRRLRLRALALASALVIAATTTLLNCSIHTIKISDGKKTYTVHSVDSNVNLAVKSVKLSSPYYEITESKTTDKLTKVKIAYGFPVYITRGDETKTVTFLGGTVKEALKKAGYNPDKYDFTEPSLDTVIEETTYIDYTDIDYVKTTKTETIKHGTKKIASEKLKKGVTKLASKGKDGVKKVTTVEKTVNGVSTKVKETVKVLSKPVAAKMYISQKDVPKKKPISTLSPDMEIKLDKNGVPVEYKSKLTVRATAYTHTGHRCSTGVKTRPGYIAVNPKVIPYGTEMYIKTADGKYIYGYAVAADTGGFVRRHPTGVDLFFDTEAECRKFGVRNAEIYILN